VGMHGRDLKSLFRWDMKRAQKVTNKLNHQLQAEARTCPFSPELSPSSRRLAQEYSDGNNVHERLFADSRRRVIEFNQEQNILKQLTPKCFAAHAEKTEQNKKRPQSAREVRKIHAPPPASVMRSLSPSPLSTKKIAPGLAAKEAKVREEIKSRKEAHRASLSVLPAQMRSQSAGTMSSAPRNKKGFAYKSTTQTGTGGWEGRKSRSYSLSHETEPPPPPKTSITQGKNIVKFNAKFTGIVDAVNTHGDVVPKEEWRASSSWKDV